MFKNYLNNDFINVEEETKKMYEKDPMSLSIAQISQLKSASTQIFENEHYSYQT